MTTAMVPSQPHGEQLQRGSVRQRPRHTPHLQQRRLRVRAADQHPLPARHHLHVRVRPSLRTSRHVQLTRGDDDVAPSSMSAGERFGPVSYGRSPRQYRRAGRRRGRTLDCRGRVTTHRPCRTICLGRNHRPHSPIRRSLKSPSAVPAASCFGARRDPDSTFMTNDVVGLLEARSHRVRQCHKRQA